MSLFRVLAPKAEFDPNLDRVARQLPTIALEETAIGGSQPRKISRVSGIVRKVLASCLARIGAPLDGVVTDFENRKRVRLMPSMPLVSDLAASRAFIPSKSKL